MPFAFQRAALPAAGAEPGSSMAMITLAFRSVWIAGNGGRISGGPGVPSAIGRGHHRNSVAGALQFVFWSAAAPGAWNCEVVSRPACVRQAQVGRTLIASHCHGEGRVKPVRALWDLSRD